MNIQRQIQVLLTTVLLIFALKSEKLRDWFWKQSVFWQVVMCMGAVSAVALILLRAFGTIDFITIIGL